MEITKEIIEAIDIENKNNLIQLMKDKKKE